MRRLLAVSLSLGLLACVSHRAAPPRGCYHAAERVETEIGYCEAVRSGNRLYVSGTVGQGDMPAAVQSTYERLQKTLEANGLGFADVVQERVFTTDLEAFKASRELRKRFYGGTLPAATWVQVQRLYSPSLVVEIELVAEYPARP